jgi:hypothetical protein
MVQVIRPGEGIEGQSTPYVDIGGQRVWSYGRLADTLITEETETYNAYLAEADQDWEDRVAATSDYRWTLPNDQARAQNLYMVNKAWEDYWFPKK